MLGREERERGWREGKYQMNGREKRRKGKKAHQGRKKGEKIECRKGQEEEWEAEEREGKDEMKGRENEIAGREEESDYEGTSEKENRKSYSRRKE